MTVPGVIKIFLPEDKRMCLPACAMLLAQRSSRRSFLRCAGVAAAGAALAPSPLQAQEPPRFSFRSVVDLTHTLGPHFPFPMDHAFAMERLSTRPNQVWNIYRWHFHEHIGTHIDAPFHCSDRDTAERIPAGKLFGPLAIIDIRAKAAADPDAQLTLDDLKAWERAHGPIPRGSIVAMCSGWDARVDDPRKFFGKDDRGRFHTPGFHLEAVEFLEHDRDVHGIAVDTISLDPGNSSDFPVHHYWLGQNKWGLENVANLGQLPPVGATIIVGSPKVAGGSGGPSRVLALVN
jgi:kynurenine formamidase